MPTKLRGVSLAALAVVVTATEFAGPIPGYIQTNLVSDIPGKAANTDPKLQNPWGISFSPGGSPFWVSDNHSGVTTLYNGAGVPQGGPLVVTIPGVGSNPGAPTGQIFNLSNAVGTTFNNDVFIFAGEDGIISGWKGVRARRYSLINRAWDQSIRGLRSQPTAPTRICTRRISTTTRLM